MTPLEKAKDNRLEAIRDANSAKKEDRTDRMEDYLEVIYELVEQKGLCHNCGYFYLSKREFAQRNENDAET